MFDVPQKETVMGTRPKPATPTLDKWRKEHAAYLGSNATIATVEHDAVGAWWKEQLAAKDAEIARLSRPRVAPSHKGVTYRDGMWWDADDEGYELASKCIADNSPQCHVAGSKQELLTDDDHAALLALKDAKPRDVRGEVMRVLAVVWCSNGPTLWPDDYPRGIESAADRILALVGEAP
jgi:hypothetical protein